MTTAAPVPIAVVMRTFDPGGTERQMIELIRRLDPGRWRVHVACFRAQGEWFDRVERSAATIAEFPLHSFRGREALACLRAFSGWCRRREIAIVQTTDVPSNVFALPAAALARVPVRLGARREINANRTAATIALQRVMYACATTVVANSEAAAARLRREWVSPSRIAVVPNGLDLAAFRDRVPRPTLRTIAVVANLRREKRHDVLIDAAPHVLRRFPDARFHIVGDGPERPALEARAKARGVAPAFTFFGHQADIAARLEAADIFVLPSESEAFPNVVLEAMAAGLPVIASDLPALRELIDDGETGRLVPAGRPERLADVLCSFLREPAAAAAVGRRARAQVQARYSFDRMVAGFEALYVAELSRHRHAAERRYAVAPVGIER